MKFWERYGKLVGAFFGGLILAGLAWGFFTDFKFTTANVLASKEGDTTPPSPSEPKEGDSCTTTNGKTGKVVNGDCVA